MARTSIAAQVKTVEVARGLFVIRYVSADDEFEPPTVSFAVDRPRNKTPNFFCIRMPMSPCFGSRGPH
jgi:hypothetical protein